MDYSKKEGWLVALFQLVRERNCGLVNTALL
jgi:hypothetical protein